MRERLTVAAVAHAAIDTRGMGDVALESSASALQRVIHDASLRIATRTGAGVHPATDGEPHRTRSTPHSICAKPSTRRSDDLRGTPPIAGRPSPVRPLPAPPPRPPPPATPHTP